MAQQKPVILADNRFEDGTITASATAADYDVNNIKDWRPYTFWKGVGTGEHTVKVDTVSANTATGLFLMGHNLNDVGATLAVECSNDDFAADITVALAGFIPSSDFALLKLFDQLDKQYWRLKMSGLSAAPFFAIAVIGDYLQFEKYMQKGDPAAERIEGSSKRNKSGQPLGATVDSLSILSSPKFNNVTPSWITNNFKPLWDSHLSMLKPFAWAWEPEDHADEVFLMQVPAKFTLSMPYNPTRRSLSLRMEGAKEI